MFCHSDQRPWVAQDGGAPRTRWTPTPQPSLTSPCCKCGPSCVRSLASMTHSCRAPSLFCLLLPPSLPSSFQRPLQVPLAYYIPACMSLSPRSHLWPPPGRNSSPNLYTVQKSRVQGLRPDSPGSHPGSCTPRGMTAVPRLSHAQQHSGSFIRFLGG